MNQQNKELLLQDLCARLPYGVMCNIGLDHPFQLQRIFVDRLDGTLLDFYEDGDDYQVYLSEVKPYLRPMSSITKEEIHEIQEILGKDVEVFDCLNIIDSSRKRFSFLELQALFNYLNAHHLDYCGLIVARDALNYLSGIEIIED